MLRSSIYSILLIIPLVITCKSTSKKLATSNVLYNMEEHIDSLLKIEYSPISIENEKFNIRIDYKGNIHTVKSKMFLKYDSLVYISFSSTFSIPIATFYAFKNKIQVVDNPQKIVYESTYEALSSMLGFPVSYKLIQSTLLGFPYQLVLTNEFSNRIINNNSVSYNYQKHDSLYNVSYTFSPTNREIMYFDIVNKASQESYLASTYTFENDYSDSYPKSIILSFFINHEPLEIEFDFREIQHTNNFTLPYDSSFIVLPLFKKNE